MISIITGTVFISLLHSIVPNHWIPVLAISKREGWSLSETIRITFLAGITHVISTIIIGVLLALIGAELSVHIEDFTKIIGPSILVLIGLYFVRQHYRHHHFQLEKKQLENKSKSSIILALVIAMFLSPCMEIEAYFLLAGSKGWYFMVLIAAIYTVITIEGMLIGIRIAYKGLLKFNWHKWEHNAGIVTGLVLIGTGIISFFIN